MTREDIGVLGQQSLASDSCQPLPFVHLDIKDDSVFVWGGPDDITWGGNTFIGIGTLGQIGNIQSDTKGGVSAVDVSVNGIDPTLLQDAKSTAYKGRSASIWIGLFDDNLSLLEDPALFVSGEMSAMSLLDGMEKGSISVTIESRGALLKKNRTTLRTDENHQRHHPGDKFFNFVPKVRQKTVYWGMQAASNTGRVSSGSRDGGRIGEYR